MTETKIFEITTNSLSVMRRLERLFALLHYSSRFGHSAIFGMSLDGDGSDMVTVKGLDGRLAHEVDAIGGVGFDVELANDISYGGRFTDRRRNTVYKTRPAANLYKDNKLVRTIPSGDLE